MACSAVHDTATCAVHWTQKQEEDMKKLMTLVLFSFAGLAMAQSAPEEPGFLQLDVDADGRLSKTEAQADARVAEKFEEADENRDGYLSVQEFTAIWS